MCTHSCPTSLFLSSLFPLLFAPDKQEREGEPERVGLEERGYRKRERGREVRFSDVGRRGGGSGSAPPYGATSSISVDCCSSRFSLPQRKFRSLFHIDFG